MAYLGHVIDADGVAMDKDKVRAVADWPTPRSVWALRGFLGLASYYRKFIKDFGMLAAPLTRLMSKERFWWCPEAQDAFQALKHALGQDPVLQMPDFDIRFIVECDASGTGFGAVLHQGAGPLAFSIGPLLHAMPSLLPMNGNSLDWFRLYVTGSHIFGVVPLPYAPTTTA